MKTIQLNIPDNLDIEEHEFSIIVAAKLYEDKKLSLGEAAQLAGLTKRTFVEIIGKYGVSIFSNSISDLYSDIAST